MVGSPFIQTRRDGRLTLLNTSQIASLYTEDIDRTTREGKVRYRDYDPAAVKLYTVQLLLTSRREMEYVFVSATERDSLYEQLLAALAPGVTIDIAEPLIAQVEPPEPVKPTPPPAPPVPPTPKPPRKPRK